jgi:hypothetical protein
MSYSSHSPRSYFLMHSVICSSTAARDHQVVSLWQSGESSNSSQGIQQPVRHDFRAKHDHTVPIGTTRTSSRQYTSLSRTPADAAFPLPPCSNTIPKADAPLGQRPRPKADCTMLVRLALSRRHSPTASIIAFKKEAAIDRSSRPSICEHSRFAAFNDVLVPRSVTCRPIGRPTIGRSGQVRSSCVGVRSG